MPGEELCSNCGTPLMLVVTPPSTRNEPSIWNAYSEEHLLERISNLELRLTQVTDRLSKVLDLMLKQSKTVQSEHLLVESLIDALAAAKVIEGGQVSQLWRERQKEEERHQAATAQRERVRERTLAGGQNEKIDLFTNLVKEGFRLVEQGEESQGLRTLERAAAMSPENFPLLAYIGEHYFRSDKLVLAREYLERANKLTPNDAKVSLLLGVILTDEGETETAKKLLEPLAEITLFAANFPLGMIYAAERKFAESLAAFKRAYSAHPSAETSYLVGSGYAELGRNKLALKHLQKAVELDANYADAWYMLGSICLRLDDEKAAKEAFAMALAARDTSAQAHAILKNPKKYAEIAQTTLLFARLAHVKQNLVSGSAPRLARVLREEIEKVLAE
jgi:tetratricopeptide (TPR) repeat protein